VGGPVVLADIRLELDDPACSPTGAIVADQPRAKERAGRVQGGPGKKRAVDDGQR
jgi:hypothetical protein